MRGTGFFFGTWNVRIMLLPGAALGVVNEYEKYKLSIVALQEVRKCGEGTIDINDTTDKYNER
jgi:hypothetical protein